MLHNPYDLIVIQPNVIPPQDMEELLELTATQDTIHATIINAKDDGQHKAETKLDVRNTFNYDLPSHIDKKLEEAIAGIFNSVAVPKYNCEFSGDYDRVQMLGYPVGGHYLPHNDGEHYSPEKDEWVRSMPRDVSMVFFLNEEFGKGELEFPELGLTIKPKKGMIVMFPSYKEFLHTVKPVTWGHRYSLVCWIGTKKKLYDTIPRPGIPES